MNVLTAKKALTNFAGNTPCEEFDWVLNTP